MRSKIKANMFENDSKDFKDLFKVLDLPSEQLSQHLVNHGIVLQS